MIPSLSFAAAPPTNPPREAAKEKVFAEAIDVSVVSIDVIVTDSKGKPVTGLTAGDFKVTEDGKPVELTNFYAEAGEPGGEAAVTGAPAAPTAKPATLRLDQRLNLAIFIDNRNITPPARNRIVTSLKRFLATHPLHAEDSVMVASYDGSVEIKLQPTSDGAVLEAALDSATKGSSRGVERLIDLRQLLDEMQRAPLPPPPPPPNDMSAPLQADNSKIEADELYNHIRSYAENRYQETRTTLLAVGQFVDSLSGLPGRKALLYVTGGLSVRPGEALFDAFQAKYAQSNSNAGGSITRGTSTADARQFDATKDFANLIERANANRVTFYTLGSPEDTSGTNAANGGDNAAWQGQAGIEAFNVTAPLHQLALETGGVSAVDNIDPGSMFDRMRLDFNSYYSLGYASRNHDGKNHRIAVETKTKGLKVRSRDTFRARTGTETTTDHLTAALMLGVAENPFGVAADFGKETADKDKKEEMRVEMTVSFPLSSVALVPQDHFHEGHVTLFFAARDSHGRTSPITHVAVPIKIPDEKLEAALGQAVGYKTTVPLRNEEHTLAISVRDEVANSDSTLRVQYTPGQGNAPAAVKADR